MNLKKIKLPAEDVKKACLVSGFGITGAGTSLRICGQWVQILNFTIAPGET